MHVAAIRGRHELLDQHAVCLGHRLETRPRFGQMAAGAMVQLPARLGGPAQRRGDLVVGVVECLAQNEHRSFGWAEPLQQRQKSE